MNKVFLIGRLTRDPEIRYTGGNIAVTRFSIAVNRNFSNANGEREADFINIIVWRKQAENCKNYLTQGSQVAIDGRIQTGNYDDKDGRKVYTTEVVADNVQFLDTKGSREMRESSNKSGSTPYDFQPEVDVQTTDVKEDPFKDFGEEIKIEDDDLPF